MTLTYTAPRHYKAPEVGFAADAARDVRAPEGMRRGPYRPDYKWPQLVVGRQFDTRPTGPGWRRFNRELEQRAGRRDAAVVPLSKLACTYITAEQMEGLLECRYPKLSRQPEDRGRKQMVAKVREEINGLIREQRRSQQEQEFIDAVSRRVRGDDAYGMADAERWGDVWVPVYGKADTSRDTEVVLPLADTDGFLAEERQAFLGMMAVDMDFQSSYMTQLRNEEWRPEAVALTWLSSPRRHRNFSTPEYPIEMPFRPPQSFTPFAIGSAGGATVHAYTA